MEKFREVVLFEDHFDEFIKTVPFKAKVKILTFIDVLEYLDIIPSNYLKHIEGTSGLYEARIDFGSDAFRIFCFFDKGRIIVLLNGFHKKTQKTPKKEIRKALHLRNMYYERRDQEK